MDLKTNTSNTIKRDKKTINVILTGLDNAGKTKFKQILDKNVKIENKTLMQGIYIKTMQYNNLNITSWDIGGSKGIMKLYNQFI